MPSPGGQRLRSLRGILSVRTGAFIVHAAGQLAGRRATIHRGSLERLRALGDVEVEEARYTHDGNVWCSAGVSAGIDLTLRFISEIAGAAAAKFRSCLTLFNAVDPGETILGEALHRYFAGIPDENSLALLEKAQRRV